MKNRESVVWMETLGSQTIYKTPNISATARRQSFG